MEFKFFKFFWEPFVAVVLGTGLTVNCLIALLRRDDVYDRGSSTWMLLTNILGILIGAVLIYEAAIWMIKYLTPS